MKPPMRIADGRLFVFVAFDIGFEIDLVRATTILAAGRAPALHPRRPAPPSVRYPEPPVETLLDDHRLPDGTVASVAARLFDFGVVSFCFTLPPPPTLAELAARGRYLAEQGDIMGAAERYMSALVERVRPAVVRFAVSDVREEYFVFQVSPGPEGPAAAELLRDDGVHVAAALTLEPAPLDDAYVRDLLATRVSYSPRDAVLCDWNAAFVYDDRWDDTVAVLEFLNVQLLELRFQDARLDRALERFAGLRAAQGGLGAFLNPYRQPVRDLAELTIESALLSERAINTMTLLGDDYLARVARSAAAPLRLADWVGTIRRKQDAVGTLYGTLNDRLANVRGEALELAIVLLIVFEILLYFAE